MGKYYIKHIYGPAAQVEGYPQGVIHFEKKQLSRMKDFAKCNGFLLYETGRQGGAKTIYGYGIISEDQNKPIPSRIVDDKEFIYGVWVDVKYRVSPVEGIPLKKMQDIIKRKNIQSPGGLIEITKSQYMELVSMLFEKSEA